LNRRIEDYALIGNRRTAALASRDGSIDWLCLPRFDSPSCFAAILGGEEQGRWLITPQSRARSVRRKYRGDTLVVETIFETCEGEVALIDFMPVAEETGRVDLIRLVKGRKGTVPMRMELMLRFDYGEIIPSIKYRDGALHAVGGPDAVLLHTPVEMHGDDSETRAEFVVSEGETIPFSFIRHESWLPAPRPDDPIRLLDQNERWWIKWASRSVYQGPYRSAVVRSLITLKALTYCPTGAIVAAPTTSLPEWVGGRLNWDYRYCWLRDSAFMMCALLVSGYTDEAVAWRKWLMRTLAGRPRKLQTVYGLEGQRRLAEFELSHLPGYCGSRPVRVGNDAYKQFQLDIYGELLGALYIGARYQIAVDEEVWLKHCEFLSFLEEAWEDPDNGIWETRSGPRHFTSSKVAAWAAFDRAVKLIESQNLKGPLEKWRAIRDRIHSDVCARAYNERQKTFVKSYDGNELDASLLLVPLRGFLPADDPRVVRTVEAIRRELMEDGLVKRFRHTSDGGEEGAFLPCTCWLVDCLIAMGRTSEARKIFERLLGLCNDVELIAEEYDGRNHRLLGNFPQALTHVALINSAANLSAAQTPLKLLRAEY
jgi:GH15 family glucan-1,4-alpha-glucosidase